jgi:hypothetical protein
MRLSLVAVVLLISGCEPEVTSTFVTGSVRGVSLPGAFAVSAADQNVLGADRRTVWIASGPVCARLRTATLPAADTFGASFVASADGGRAPALILTTEGNALFDTGVGEERIRGTSTLKQQKTDGNGTSARFTATFTTDAGTETVTGDYVATACANANPGCSAAPGLLIAAAALMLARRQRDRGALYKP